MKAVKAISEVETSVIYLFAKKSLKASSVERCYERNEILNLSFLMLFHTFKVYQGREIFIANSKKEVKKFYKFKFDHSHSNKLVCPYLD